MPRLDTFGKLPIPVTAGAGLPFGDPALFLIADFLKAFLNAYGTPGWQEGAPGLPLVREAFTHNPEKLSFNEKHLPALYLYRLGSAEGFLQKTDGHQCRRDHLRVMWIEPPVPQATALVRDAFTAAVQALVDSAVEDIRDPCWVVPFDPDAKAERLGSNLLLLAELEEISRRERWVPAKLTIPVRDGEPRTYDGTATNLLIEERRHRGGYDLLSHTEGVIRLASDDPLPVVEFEWPIPDP